MGSLTTQLHVVVVAIAQLSLAWGRLCDVDPGSSNFLTLGSQQRVDWFGREKCTAVPGGIYIGGDVKDVSPLQNLTRLGTSDDGWSLRIAQASELKMLSGFVGSNLHTVPGAVWVQDCPQLLSLEGLEGIVSISSLIVQALPRLRDLRGLCGLRGSVGNIVLRDCPLLQSLDGLESISSADSVILVGLSRLRNLQGLRGLRGSMSGGLQLLDCQALLSLQGLENIPSLGSNSRGLALHLSALNITSLDGLRGLRGELGGAIDLGGCNRLSTLGGLEGVTMLGRTADAGRSLGLRDLHSLTSLRGLAGLTGMLPGSLEIVQATALVHLEGLQGLSGVCGSGCLTGFAIRVENCLSLRSVLGLRGLWGSLNGSLWLAHLPALPSLGGLEGLTGMPTLWAGPVFEQIAVNIQCGALESLNGLGGMTGTVNGTIRVVSGRLQSLGAVPASITLTAGYLHISTGGPVCDRAEVLDRLQAVQTREPVHILVPQGKPLICRSCQQPCRSYRGRRVTCDVLRGGCRCPLGRAGPDCLETPVLDVALPPDEVGRTLRIERPRPGVSTVRKLALCVPLWRSGSLTSGNTAVRVRELQGHDSCPSRDAGYSLLPPFNLVTWSSGDPTRGCLTVHLEVWRSQNCSSPLRLVLAYESPSGGRYPDHLINHTLHEVGDVWDHPWPECLHIGTCSEQQDQMALVVHFVEPEDCPENMEPDYTSCEAGLCPASIAHPGDNPGATVPRLQRACECLQGQALKGRCVAKPGHWALDDFTPAVPCPFLLGGVSTCLGSNRCSPGYEGVMCAACPVGRVQQNGICGACGSGQGILCVFFGVLFVAVAASLPHLLSYLVGQDGPASVHWFRLWVRLKITYLKLQELLLWSWGFLLLFPEVRQHQRGFFVLTEAFSSLAFPTFFQCGCGVDTFGEFGILVLAPSAFVMVASASAGFAASTSTPILTAAGPHTTGERSSFVTWTCRLVRNLQIMVSSTCKHGSMRDLWFNQLRRKRKGLQQLLFWALRFTFSPITALIMVYYPSEGGVGFHCVDRRNYQLCFFRRDYRLRLSSFKPVFQGWWQLCFASQGFTWFALVYCLCSKRMGRALFYTEFRQGRASFEMVNLLKETLHVLSFTVDSWLFQLCCYCLVSSAYLILLHLIEPYRNQGDKLLQSFHTLGGMAILMPLIVETHSDAGWARLLVHSTASAVLLSIAVAPLFAVLCNPLRRSAAARARSNSVAYDSLVLEECNTGRGSDKDSMPSLCSLLLEGMYHIEMRCKAEGSRLPDAVTYAKRFHLEEFVQPGDSNSYNKRWVHLYPGSEVLTQETVGRLLRALSSILVEVVGRGRRRPEVRLCSKRPEMFVPSQGTASALHSVILLREMKARPAGPSLRQLLVDGIFVLDNLLDGEEVASMSMQGRKDKQIRERLEPYELEEVPQGHVAVRARGRSMDHKEATELPNLLQRPLELGCCLHGMCRDPERCLRIALPATTPEPTTVGAEFVMYEF